MSRRTGWIGGMALTGVTVLWLGLIWLWPPSPVTLTVDDSFYYLQTARNVAEGYGSTFDRVQPTNGYHPLWLLALVPIGGMEGDDGPVRWALTLQLFLAVGGILWVSRAGGFLRRSRGVLAFALLSFYGTKVLLNGQEAALQWFFLCGVTAFLARDRDGSDARSPAYRGTVVGTLGALAALARLEAAVFGAAAAVLPLLWPRDETRNPGGMRRILIPLGILGGALSLHGAWSLKAFGHSLPVSAAIESQQRDVGWGTLAWALVAAAIAAAGYRKLARGSVVESDAEQARLRALTPLVVYCVFFGISHSFGGWRWVLRIWYLVPFLLLAVFGAGWALERIVGGYPGTRRRRLVGAVAVVAIGYLSVAAAGWSHRLDPASYSTDLAARRTGRWIRDTIPPGDSLAGWDIGTTAWYSRRGITNLEGLAASWEYKRLILDRNRVADYVNEQRRIDHLVQPLPARMLTGTGSLRYEGVDLAPWRVARADCVRFRSVVPWTRPWWRVHLVLNRKGGVRLGDLQPSDVCPD